MNNYQDKWNSSYLNRDNFVFSPNEEVIRFVSKYIRKRISLNEYNNIIPSQINPRILDLGCGIGRHVIYCHKLNLESYGIDLSNEAIRVAIDWAEKENISDPSSKILQGDIRNLPWEEGFFNFAVSHGVLDSMPFEIARTACIELSNKMVTGGYFYCDLISGDDSNHAREYSGEEIVESDHEHGTVQLYFNLQKIYSLIGGVFKIVECILIRHEDVLIGGYFSRYHLVLEKI